MGKITLLFCTLWAIGAIVLILMAISRAFFDEPQRGWSRGELFGIRVFIAFFWWLMLLSPSGRKMIGELWKGFEVEKD